VNRQSIVRYTSTRLHLLDPGRQETLAPDTFVFCVADHPPGARAASRHGFLGANSPLIAQLPHPVGGKFHHHCEFFHAVMGLRHPSVEKLLKQALDAPEPILIVEFEAIHNEFILA